MIYFVVVITKLLSNDGLFPSSVKNLKNSPEALYVLHNGRGQTLSWPRQSLAVIGSRNISEYGRNVVLDFVPRLVGAGTAIISGLAEGVDEEAQRVALRCGGQTIGVLGFGFARIADFSNRQLCEEIIKSEKGILVSQFPPHAGASNQTFLERNRLIAALSDAVLVVEASLRSGCMSTVEAALDLGKEVYVVPGDIFSYNSMGTNELIRQGAHLTSSVIDIIDRVI